MLLASALRPFEAVHVLVVSLPGWEQMAQTVSGCMVANAGDDGTPRNLPSAPTDFNHLAFRSRMPVIAAASVAGFHAGGGAGSSLSGRSVGGG